MFVNLKKMFKKTEQLVFLLILLIIGFSSCNKEETHWQSDVLIPILSSEMGVDDIFGTENVVSNPDQSMSLVISEDVQLLRTDSVIEIDDTLAVDVFNVPFTFTIPPGQKVIEKQTESKIDFGDMELTMAKAKNAKLKFYVTNSIKQPLLVRYTLYSAIKDGAIYQVEERVEAATDSQNSFVIKEINLDDYYIDLSGPNHNNYNTIYALTTVWIHPDGDTAIVKPTDTVLIVSTFDEFEPSYAYGYLGSQQLEAYSVSAINAFGNFVSGTFDLNNINASIDVYNYLGVDLSLEIIKFASKNNESNTVINLNHPIVGSILNIDRASESGNDDYPVWAKHYSYDISNSNLDNMVEIMPDSFMLEVKGVLNPLGNISAGNDFIYFDKGVEAKVKMEIPLNFSANNLIIEDISNINFDEESVKGGFLNVFMENAYPFNLDVQFYIIDEIGIVVDSLFKENTVIESAVVDNQGYVVQNTKTKLKVKLTDELLEILRNNERMLIHANINSLQNKKYILFEYHKLSIKIVGDFVYEI